MGYNNIMEDKIEKLKPGRPKKLPSNAEVASVEDIISYAMFEYYARLYTSNKGMTRDQLLNNVATNFHKTPGFVYNLYQKNRWYMRAKKLQFDRDITNLPGEFNTILDKMVSDAAIISSLGTRLISDYLLNVQYDILTPRDVFKLGMLVVECSRLANEIEGGTGNGTQNANIVKLVINE